MTEREYLISLGLAKAGRGRYSKDAREALDKAKADGMQFDLTPADVAKLERKNKPTRKAVAVAPKESRPSQDSYNAKAVRAWGEQTGAIEKGKRGKLPTALINAYLAANKSEPAKKVVRVSGSRQKVRDVAVGYTYARRGPKDPAFVSEPLVAVQSCGGCSKGISFCGCKSGPTAPKYLGGEVLLLTRPSE
ncbi:DNA bridging protein [Streptomyces phage Comrade]|uniref:DNA bridging protein n=3 Tax=Gilsonvirus comrade TaxID=2846395 RepID=A0A345MEB4_9CAUD|nr:Lsr2-like DNA bridging protein [Streptomyces phage Comrade]AXH68895.1 DNA bridging protein [Streptomyces phage SparkleGoddess]AXQ63450.1 DNA bridging protein [Streptomyces phage Comrade]QQO39869.1 Lsr2-like DNA bridging protein [Streptomyces phage Belfort]UTN92439.1 Lsr2-like DNA bridging protein [Streptomyces phage Stigma]